MLKMKEANSENIIKAIKIIQSRNFQELGFYSEPSCKLLKIFVRPFSNIAKAKFYSKEKNITVYLKESYPKIGDYNERKKRTRKSYDFLKELYENFGLCDNFSALKPIFLFEDLCVIVIEEKKGFPLFDLIRSQKYSPLKLRLKELEKYFFLCGKFLSEFQKLDKLVINNCFKVDEIPEYISARIDKIERYYNFPSIRDYKADIMRFLNSICNDAPGIKYVKTFKDYIPGNILISDGKVVPFDPSQAGGFDGAHPYQDVCNLYVYLDNINFGFKKETLSGFKKELLRGYGQDNIEQNPFFDVFQIRHKILRLCNIFENEKIAFIKRRKAERYFVRFVEWFKGINSAV